MSNSQNINRNANSEKFEGDGSEGTESQWYI